MSQSLSQIKIRIINRDQPTSLKRATKLVAKNRAVFIPLDGRPDCSQSDLLALALANVALVGLQILTDQEIAELARNRRHTPKAPRLMWPAWYKPVYPTAQEWQECWGTTEAAVFPPQPFSYMQRDQRAYGTARTAL